MKGLQYITHDLGARNDPKLLTLQMEMGGQGLAIFWCLVEMLWENDGRLPLDPHTIAFSLRWATADEVDKVIREFGLFEIDGDHFFSRSALERIQQKKDSIEAASERGRKAIAARWNRARGSENDADEIPQKYGCNTDVIPRNKEINKDINIDNNTITPQAADFYEFMFFKNFVDPAGEAQRFVEHYADNGWTYQDGTPVADPLKAAKGWKPEVSGKRFNEAALRWYKGVWMSCKNHTGNLTLARKAMLESLVTMKVQERKLTLVYSDEDSAARTGAYIQANQLSGEWHLEFRVRN